MFHVVLPLAALLAGVALLLMGSGLLGTLLAVRGGLEGFDETTLGLVMSGYFFWLTADSPFGTGFFEVVFFMFPVVAGSVAFWVVCRKARQYEEAEKQYLQSRGALREEIRQVQSQLNSGSPLSL